MPSRKPTIEVVDERVAEILREKTPAERIAITDGLWRCAGDMIHAITAREHPDWSPEQVQREVARRMSHGAV
jgi:hypothetical protein